MVDLIADVVEMVVGFGIGVLGSAVLLFVTFLWVDVYRK
jgi:hypothetical protein